jgi:hypothetical protein
LDCVGMMFKMDDTVKWLAKKNWSTHVVLDNEKRTGQNTYRLSIILGL